MSWFREHRTSHPEDDVPLGWEEAAPGDAELGWKTNAEPSAAS